MAIAGKQKIDSAEVLALASRAGHVLLENGAEISRVEDVMQRIAEYYGERNESFFVLSNGIFTTGKDYSKVEFIPIRSVNLEKVDRVNRLSREIADGKWTFSRACEQLERIASMRSKPFIEQLAGTALGCLGFCAIFGGGIMDCVSAMVAGVLMNIFVLLSTGRLASKMFINICGGIIGTSLCVLFQHAGFGDNMGNMMVGTLIPLIPGVPFTNGLRDISKEDYIAGTTRLLDALLVFFSIATGVCATFLCYDWITGSMIVLHGTSVDSVTSLFPVQIVAAFIGTSAFSVLFGVPRRHYATTGLVGMFGWMIYLLSMRLTPLSVALGTFAASLGVSLISYLFARQFRCSNTIFLICGIFPLIPGAGVFWSTYYAVSGQSVMALSAGFTAVKITVAIVLGIIVIANVMPHKHKRQFFRR